MSDSEEGNLIEDDEPMFSKLKNMTSFKGPSSKTNGVNIKQKILVDENSNWENKIKITKQRL